MNFHSLASLGAQLATDSHQPLIIIPAESGGTQLPAAESAQQQQQQSFGRETYLEPDLQERRIHSKLAFRLICSPNVAVPQRRVIAWRQWQGPKVGDDVGPSSSGGLCPVGARDRG